MNVRAEAVRILLAKAAQDELAARQLAADARIGDEVVGFHIQQAAEKRLRGWKSGSKNTSGPGNEASMLIHSCLS